MWFTIDKRSSDAIKELENSSDRAVGIIAGVMVDSQLYDALSQFFLGDDESYSTKVRKEMFNADGALGGFGARANLAYLIGLLSKDAHTDLQTFAKIRNSFAHYTEHDTFETESIRARCENFKLINTHVTKAFDASVCTVPRDSVAVSGGGVVTLNLVDVDTALQTPKGRFISTTKLFCAVFSNFADEKNWEKYPLI